MTERSRPVKATPEDEQAPACLPLCDPEDLRARWGGGVSGGNGAPDGDGDPGRAVEAAVFQDTRSVVEEVADDAALATPTRDPREFSQP